MRSILNTMPYEVPFNHERAGGYGNLNVTPLANKGYLLPFIMPAVETNTITDQYIVEVDQDGNFIKQTNVPGFLETMSIGGKFVFINNMNNNVYTILGSDLPCGHYYYVVEAPGHKYKTGIFEIDNNIDHSQMPELPLVPLIRGDFSDDFSDDFYI
jgi:hypothetical protein